jgi:AsmA protein
MSATATAGPPKRKRKLRIVLGTVVALMVVGILSALAILDGYATRKAQEQAAAWSGKLGRKIEVGRISTTFFTGLGAKVGPVSIGPGQGETEPLLAVGSVEVKVAALRALFSLGKRVEVRSAEVSGLELNMVRYADGTTNLERLQERLAEVQAQEGKQQEPKTAPEPKTATDLSAVRVDHAALRDGRITFVDRSNKGANALAVRQIDLAVDDLRAGAPLKVSLKAAVLANKQNLALDLYAAPLPKTLVPTPTRVTLKVQPAIDLAPLGPFLPRGVGLEAGTLDADFDASLGAAVAGGKGPTRIKGAVHALALKFAGASAGKPLDVVLDTDVTGDAEKGDVSLDRLKLDFGPAGLSGKGRALGLMSGAPKIEGLEITSHDLDPAKLAAYYPPLRKALGGELSGPIGISVRGAGTAAAQQLQATIDLTPVHMAMPLTLAKAAGAPMVVTLQLQGAGARQQRFQLTVDLAGVDLRPGQSLNKAPGDRLDMHLTGLRKVSGEKQQLDVSEVDIRAKGDELKGKATADLDAGKKTKGFDLDLHGSRLNLDQLLLQTSAKKPQKPQKPPDPKTYEGLSGRAALRLDTVVYKKQQMRNAVVVAKLEGDALTLEQAGLEAFSGKVDAAGTSLRLAHPDAPFHAKAKVSNLQLDQATAMVASKKVLGGKLDASADLTGAGRESESIRKTLTGNVNGHLLDGVFYGKDLVAEVTGPLAKSLPFGLAGKSGSGGQTSLGKDVPISITVANGEARLAQPLVLKLPEADITLTGAMTLDGRLDMPATVALWPGTVSKVTGGKASVNAPVPVTMRLVGPVSAPTVTNLDLKDAVASIVKGAAAGALGKVLGGSGQGGAEQQAREAAQKQEQAAQQKAQEAAKKAADQASNKLKGLFGR